MFPSKEYCGFMTQLAINNLNTSGNFSAFILFGMATYSAIHNIIIMYLTLFWQVGLSIKECMTINLLGPLSNYTAILLGVEWTHPYHD